MAGWVSARQSRAFGAAVRAAPLLDALGQAVIELTADGVVASWNTAAETMFGRAREDVIGLPLGGARAALAGAGRTGTRSHPELACGGPLRREVRASRSDGSTFPALVLDVPLLAENGACTRVFRLVTDLTEPVAAAGMRAAGSPLAGARLAVGGCRDHRRTGGVPGHARDSGGRPALRLAARGDRRPARARLRPSGGRRPGGRGGRPGQGGSGRSPHDRVPAAVRRRQLPLGGGDAQQSDRRAGRARRGRQHSRHSRPAHRRRRVTRVRGALPAHRGNGARRNLGGRYGGPHDVREPETRRIAGISARSRLRDPRLRRWPTTNPARSSRAALAKPASAGSRVLRDAARAARRHPLSCCASPPARSTRTVATSARSRWSPTSPPPARQSGSCAGGRPTTH